jgi:hypothetical protein
VGLIADCPESKTGAIWFCCKSCEEAANTVENKNAVKRSKKVK